MGSLVENFFKFSPTVLPLLRYIIMKDEKKDKKSATVFWSNFFNPNKNREAAAMSKEERIEREKEERIEQERNEEEVEKVENEEKEANESKEENESKEGKETKEGNETNETNEGNENKEGNENEEVKATKEGKEEFAGEIKNMGILDLTGLENADKLQRTSSLENIGAILVPENMLDSLMNISMKNVGSIIPIPSGEKYKLRTGQMTLSANFLASGEEDTLLILSGQIIIKETPTKIGFKGLHVNGQLMAPEDSKDLLEQAIDRSSGQILYYKGKNPKTLTGEQSFSRKFFELIEEPVTLILVGESTFEGSIPDDLLREKIADLIVVGELKAEKDVVPVLQLIASSVTGVISTI